MQSVYYRLSICLAAILLGFGNFAVQAQTTCTPSLSNGLLLRLPLNEATGSTATDVTGNGRNGTVLNTQIWRPASGMDRHGALELTGNARLEIPFPHWTPTAFTVAWWVKPYKTFNYNQAVFSGHNDWGGFMFHTTDDGSIAAGTTTWQNCIYVPQAMELNVWQQYIFTFDNGAAKLYKNGQLVGSQTGLDYPQPWDVLSVGQPNKVNEAAEGLYDDLRVYDRALTGSEAASLYQCRPEGIPTPAVAPVQLSLTPGNTTVASGAATVLRAESRVAGNALAFDGIDDMVDITDAQAAHAGLLSSVTNNFTVEAWVWPTATHDIIVESNGAAAGAYGQRYALWPTQGGVLSPDNSHAGMGISVGTNGVSVIEHTGGYMPAVLVWPGTLTGWTHIAVTYQNGVPSLYVNGVFAKQGVNSSKPYVHPSLQLGGGGYGYYAGKIDEFRIWNSTRTAQQIASTYSVSLPSSTAGIVGYWHLDESEDAVYDATSRRNDGVLTRGILWRGTSTSPPTATGPERIISDAPLSVPEANLRWSPATGLSTAVGSETTASPTTTTTYTVTVNGPDNQGSAQQSVTLTVNTTTGNGASVSPYAAAPAVLTPADWAARTQVSVAVPRVSACGLLTGGKVIVQLDSGPSHATGKASFSTQVPVLLTFSANNAGLASDEYSRNLTISGDKPEMQYVIDVPARFLPAAGVSRNASDLTVSLRVNGDVTATGSQPAARRLSVRIEPQYTVDPLPVPTLQATTVQAGLFEQQVAWEVGGCSLIRNYQVQLVHRPILLSGNTTTINDAEWSRQGLLLETGSDKTALTLSLAEGEGTYYWRVRALGNAPDGVANPANWGPWSAVATFAVTAPDADLNWIYSRTFTEGGRAAEKLTLANGLQQVRQVQTRLAGPDQASDELGRQTVATQIVQDYSGRDAVTSLPIPVPNTGSAGGTLGYKPGLLKNTAGTVQSYSAADFDLDVPNDKGTAPTVAEPSRAAESGYYSSSTTGNNDRVADAEGYPFTRTRFANDGTGRVTEQGGVGEALHLRPGKELANGTTEAPRTVRTDYTDATPSELVRMFGAEAPDADGVYKIVTVDPNNIASVTYQTKDGKTIATALAVTSANDSTLLRPLPSAANSEFSISQTITGQGRIIGKPLVLTARTKVEIDYRMTPGSIAASCPEYYCATCDYQVKLRIVDAKLTTPAAVKWDTTIVVPSTLGCSPVATGLPKLRGITLAAGAYRVERELVPLNYYALPAGSAAVTPVTLNDHLNKLRTFIREQTTGDPRQQATIWDKVAYHLDNNDLEGLYSALNTAGIPTVAGTGTGETVAGQSYYSIPMKSPGTTACLRTFRIPILTLSCAMPLESGKTYEDELLAKIQLLGRLPSGANRTIADYVPGFTAGAINQLIDNQLGLPNVTPQRRDDIRNCWLSTLNSFVSDVRAAEQGNGSKYSLLDAYLNCTGYSMTTPKLGGIAIPYAFQEFSYQNTDAHKNCFNGVYARYKREVEQVTVASTPLPISDIVTFFSSSAVSAENRATYYGYVYDCLKNVPAIPQPALPTVVDNLAEALNGKAQLEQECRNACESRRVEFRTALINQFHYQRQAVEGDKYAWEPGPNGLAQMTATELTPAQVAGAVAGCQLDFMAQELVEQCKTGDCNLSVLVNGTEYVAGSGSPVPPNASFQIGTEAQHLRVQKALFHQIELSVTLGTNGASCPGYTPVPKLPGNAYQRVELTYSGKAIVQYLSSLHKGVLNALANPNRPVLTLSAPGGMLEGFSEQHWDMQTLSNVFEYGGPVRPVDMPWEQYNSSRQTLEERDLTGSYWVQVVDDRNIAPTRTPRAKTVGLPFDPVYDYLLTWHPHVFASSGNLTATPKQEDAGTQVDILQEAEQSPSGLALGSGLTETAGLPGIERYSDISSGLNSPISGPWFIMRLVDQNNVPISKQTILEISPSASLASLSRPYPAAMLDPLSSSYVQAWVRVATGNGGSQWVLATLVSNAYSADYLPNAAPSAQVTEDFRVLRWKEIGPSCTSNNRDYTLCYRWKETLDETIVSGTPADGVFTGEPESCAVRKTREVRDALVAQIKVWEQSEVDALTTQFQQNCVALQNQQETFTISYAVGYHHFTLYYYDRGGNLVKTIPPAGAAPLTAAQMRALNLTDRTTWPQTQHKLTTTYTYNSLHQLVSQQSPDGGLTRFFYNRKGQLRFSQNAKQRQESTYSYTRYDNLGRVTEVGYSSVNVSGPVNGQDLPNVIPYADDMSFPGMDECGEVTRTVYGSGLVETSDGPISLAVTYLNRPDAPDTRQANLTNRVAVTFFDGDPGTRIDDVYTYYSYDVHGNVQWLCQEQPVLGRKFIKYEYDLISNKVLKVLYQEGQPDQFYHRYEYDGDNRLTKVFTSTDNVIWDQDAKYEYYAHGPLKRMEVGEDQVQGIDYTYTLQGWLKGVNHPTQDPGRDGTATVNTATAKDAFGMTLGYFSGDFKTNNATWNSGNGAMPTPNKSLFNGNITTWTTNTRNDLSSLPSVPTPEGTVAEQFNYDHLNRLLGSRFYQLTGSSAFQEKPDYQTRYAYDPNGNLLGLTRKGKASISLEMDRLSYAYKPNTNQLIRVDDAVADNGMYDDVKPAQPDGLPSTYEQYTYDPIGNLTASKDEGVSNIQWSVYGKILHAESVKNAGRNQETHSTDYRYDAAGNRVAKAMQNGTGWLGTVYETHTTYYVRDAQGNILATYDQLVPSGGTGDITLLDHSMYGSSRLGVHRPTGVAASSGNGFYTRVLDQKQYELTDHLGNVRAVVGDVKLPEASGTFKPDLLAYYGYYPFGMLQPGRTAPDKTTGLGGYRYGFNGKEKDDNRELGSTNYDYGFRIYNPGVARFLSVDPLIRNYPSLTPYQFASNTPIQAIDLDGLEGYKTVEAIFTQGIGKTIKTTVYLDVYYVTNNTKGGAMASSYTKQDEQDIKSFLESEFNSALKGMSVKERAKLDRYGEIEFKFNLQEYDASVSGGTIRDIRQALNDRATKTDAEGEFGSSKPAFILRQDRNKLKMNGLTDWVVRVASDTQQSNSSTLGHEILHYMMAVWRPLNSKGMFVDKNYADHKLGGLLKSPVPSSLNAKEVQTLIDNLPNKDNEILAFPSDIDWTIPTN